MFDFTEFFSVSVNGIPLLFVVLGLVTLLWRLGVKDQALMVASLLIGLVLGIAYQLSVLGIPTTFAGWFAVIFFGLALGLVASGVYDTGKKLVDNAFIKSFGGPPMGRD